MVRLHSQSSLTSQTLFHTLFLIATYNSEDGRVVIYIFIGSQSNSQVKKLCSWQSADAQWSLILLFWFECLWLKGTFINSIMWNWYKVLNISQICPLQNRQSPCDRKSGTQFEFSIGLLFPLLLWKFLRCYSCRELNIVNELCIT